jgi:low affinity Fe/Cu permease
MSKLFTRFAGWCAWSFGHPLAFILACLATLAWAVTGRVFNYSDTWQLVINTAEQAMIDTVEAPASAASLFKGLATLASHHP